MVWRALRDPDPDCTGFKNSDQRSGFNYFRIWDSNLVWNDLEIGTRLVFVAQKTAPEICIKTVTLRFVPFHFVPCHFVPVISSLGHFARGHFVPWSFRPLLLHHPLPFNMCKIILKCVTRFSVFTRCNVVGTWSREYQLSSSYYYYSYSSYSYHSLYNYCTIALFQL
jgi:hypothetical protein